LNTKPIRKINYRNIQIFGNYATYLQVTNGPKKKIYMREFRKQYELNENKNIIKT
jgi:hypothetical protein